MKLNYTYKALVTNVVDGDTFDVVVDLGFKITTHQRLRLVSVDTPEIRGAERPEGLKVKAYVKELIEGKEFTIETFKIGKFGRYVAEIYLNDGEGLSEHLLGKNMATKLNYS